MVTVWSLIATDWVIAILPCHHSAAIYGGKIACITPEGEIEWQVEKKQQVAGSHESNLNVKSIGSEAIAQVPDWVIGTSLFFNIKLKQT